jgi:hypothetical protein
MDPVPPAVVGTLSWGVALVLLVLARDSLAPQDHWWVWTAATGFVVGVAGVLVARRYRPQSRATGSSATGSSATGSAGSGSVSSS